jgi:hypothetical protein
MGGQVTDSLRKCGISIKVFLAQNTKTARNSAKDICLRNYY